MLSHPLRYRLLAAICMLTFLLLWEGLDITSCAQAYTFTTDNHRGQTLSPSSPFPQPFRSRPLRCPSLQKFSYNPETAELEWEIEQYKSARPWAVLIDPAGQPATPDLTGSLIDPAPGPWILSYGAKSCSYQATATLDIPRALACPSLEDFSYDTETKELQWAINPQGNTSTFVDVINPAGSVASHSLEGSLFDPLSGTWVVEYGAQNGCDFMGAIFTDVPSTEAPGTSP